MTTYSKSGQEKPKNNEGFKSVIKGEPIQQNIRKEFNDLSKSNNYPVGQPLSVVICIGSLNRLKRCICCFVIELVPQDNFLYNYPHTWINKCKHVCQQLSTQIEKYQKEKYSRCTKNDIGLGYAAFTFNFNCILVFSEFFVKASQVKIGLVFQSIQHIQGGRRDISRESGVFVTGRNIVRYLWCSHTCRKKEGRNRCNLHFNKN